MIHRLMIGSIALTLLLAFSEYALGQAPALSLGAPPEFGNWEIQMRFYGAENCRRLSNRFLSSEDRLANTYYDAERVFYQIADYTGDSSWISCAMRAQSIYRDMYVFRNGGKAAGYWKFSRGITENYLRTGDRRSRKAALLLAKVAPFSQDATSLALTAKAAASREVAYTILAYLDAERMGQPRRRRLGILVEQALGHIDQWFVRRSAPYVRPFMAGLTAEALIAYNEVRPDKRILPALQRAADWLWDFTWLPDSEAFMYTDRPAPGGGQEAAPDLNLLIAPLFAWLYHETGDLKYLERGDQIFAGGVKFAWLGNGKQFNQNYRWSFDYIKWRNG